MAKEPAIIVDMDGTLSNSTHRKHLMEQEPKEWEKFYSLMGEDPVNEWCRKIVDRFKVDHKIIIVTGRSEDHFTTTKNWLARYQINHDLMLGRRPDDRRDDFVVKRELYEEHIEPNFDILFCMDDRQQVVDMWRRLGLTCLQCDVGNF